MNRHWLGGIGLFTLIFAGVALTMTPLAGQTQEPKKLPTQLTPEEGNKGIILPVSAVRNSSNGPWERLKNDSSLPLLTQQLLPTYHRSAEFLVRMQQANGRFLSGWVTSLNRPLEGDHFLNQAMATFTLCKIARFMGDEKYTARARQSVLTLLSETATESDKPHIRRTIHAPMTCNRLAGSSYVLMCICELPDPTPDMIAKGEELAEFVRSQQKSDGSFQLEEQEATEEAIAEFIGPAVYSLALSHRSKPSETKLEVLKKTLAFYRPIFQAKPSLKMVPWFSSAYALSFELSSQPQFAEAVLEMNDWLCKYQYDQADALHPDWRGGFQTIENGKLQRITPSIATARYCQSLADACRVLRKLPKADLDRYNKYRTALQKGLMYLSSLQFTKENTLHLAPKYADALVGGFYSSSQDGTLRIQQSSWGTVALLHFLQSGAERD
jgi:hypothetical protein